MARLAEEARREAGSEPSFPATWARNNEKKKKPLVIPLAPVNRAGVNSRPRAQSAPVKDASALEAEAKVKLRQEGGTGRSLPGSPRWTDDMNPGNQPDGVFSKQMMETFKRAVRSLLRPCRFGGTPLEAKVEAKRSKHNQLLWAEARNEGRTGGCVVARTSLWKGAHACSHRVGAQQQRGARCA